VTQSTTAAPSAIARLTGSVVADVDGSGGIRRASSAA
jgi:hypothetical protein